MRKGKILVFIDWFTPAFKAGGPIKSVTNIIAAMSNDFSFDIVTSNKDIGEINPLSNIRSNEWIDRKSYRIIYLSENSRKDVMKDILKSSAYDFIYFNSAFSLYFTIKPLMMIRKFKLSSKVIIAPRGMFGKGALAIKPLKKKIFLTIATTFGLYRNVKWHATNEHELLNIRIIFGNNIEYGIAGNISFTEIDRKSLLKRPGEVKLVFFSRISPKKNLLFLLERMADIADQNISLDIYGPIEDKDYWTSCLEMIKKSCLNAKYLGPVTPDQVQKVLPNYHFFVLPTRHENFGHVIVEALVAGCGVIISDQTPWNNFQSHKIGWNIELTDKVKWNQILQIVANLDNDEYSLLRERSYQYVIEEIDDSREIEATKGLFS